MLVVLDDKGDVITLNGRGAAMLDEEGLVSSNRFDVLTHVDKIKKEVTGRWELVFSSPGVDKGWGAM